MRYGFIILLMAGLTAGAAVEPNEPLPIAAEGVIAIETPTAAVTVMTAAGEIPEFRYRLTYWPGERTDGDAWGLYEQFFAADPNHPEQAPDAAFLREQLGLGAEAMNLETLGAYLAAREGKLELLEQAVRCRTVVWPKMQIVTKVPRIRGSGPFYVYDLPLDSGQPILEIAEMPQFLARMEGAGMLLAAAARYHIARGDYEQACRWLRAGLAQARQMTENIDALPAMAGAVNAGRMLGQIEFWVRQPNAPSLFRSLGDLPRPLIRFWQVRQDSPRVDEDDYSSGDILEVEPELLMQAPQIIRRLERYAAALQCVEAIRLHAALNDGRFPESPAEIAAVRVPLDPVTREAFFYERHNGSVTLSCGDEEKWRLEFRYRIIDGPEPERGPLMDMPGMDMMF